MGDYEGNVLLAPIRARVWLSVFAGGQVIQMTLQIPSSRVIELLLYYYHQWILDTLISIFTDFPLKEFSFH